MMIVRSRQCLPLQSDPEGAARRYVVAFMALVGISTALLVNMLGQARIWTMAAREHLIPLFWARVSQRFGTPIAAQVTMGAASGEWRLIALFMALQQARQQFTPLCMLLIKHTEPSTYMLCSLTEDCLQTVGHEYSDCRQDSVCAAVWLMPSVCCCSFHWILHRSAHSGQHGVHW